MSRMKISSLILTFDHMTWKSFGNNSSLGASTVPRLAITKQICTKTISLTLTFVHVNWTSIEVIFSLKAFTIPSLATFKQRSQDILSGQHFFSKTRSLALTFDHVIWKLIGVTYSLGAFTVPSLDISSKGVKRYWSDIAWSTDRPIGRYKTICPFFQMGA